MNGEQNVSHVTDASGVSSSSTSESSGGRKRCSTSANSRVERKPKQSKTGSV